MRLDSLHLCDCTLAWHWISYQVQRTYRFVRIRTFQCPLALSLYTQWTKVQCTSVTKVVFGLILLFNRNKERICNDSTYQQNVGHSQKTYCILRRDPNFDGLNDRRMMKKKKSPLKSYLFLNDMVERLISIVLACGESVCWHQIVGVYETPSAKICPVAHLDVEKITMDKEVIHLRDMLLLKFSKLIYNEFLVRARNEPFCLRRWRRARNF